MITPLVWPDQRPWGVMVSAGLRTHAKPNSYSGADAKGAADVERAAVTLDDMLHDREAQSSAAGSTAARGVHAIETLGDPRQVFARDPCSMVRDAKDQPIRINSAVTSIGAPGSSHP